mgnify:CR=1 FL=1
MKKGRRFTYELSYSRTILVGFAFLSICAFWQMYDNLVPLILKNNFGIGDTLSGFIMVLNNMLAVLLLASAPGGFERLSWCRQSITEHVDNIGALAVLPRRRPSA